MKFIWIFQLSPEWQIVNLFRQNLVFFPLKYFFSEGIATESGDDVSSREVKYYLKEVIDNEDKKKPLSDDKLEKLLKAKGYNIARRTVC